jgi:predicted Fe-Mo cluster-binding NifX family protein
MRVAVSSTGAGLDAPISQQFGRCPMFVFVETSTMESEAAANPSLEAVSGSGIEAAQFIAERGAEAVITGAVGPNAMNVLQAAGMSVYRHGGGTVRQAVEKFETGDLELIESEGASVIRSPDRRQHEARQSPATAARYERGVERTRIAFSVDFDGGLDSLVSHHFGRCPYYVLVDVEGREVREVSARENPFYNAHQPGQVPRFLRQQDADVIVTGGMGRRAIAIFEAENVETVTGAQGTVAEALADYLGGRLAGAEPCRESRHHSEGRHHRRRHTHDPRRESTDVGDDRRGPGTRRHRKPPGHPGRPTGGRTQRDRSPKKSDPN